MNRKWVAMLSTIILLVTVGLAYSGILKPKQVVNKQEQIVTRSDISIAIVNEDAGTDYNNQFLRVGDILIKSFAESKGYQVETVSRSTATAGLDNGKYQMIVVLPSNFSKEVLALESTTPKQAVFQYRIKSDKQVLLKQAEQAVVDLNNSFNQDIINIYFSSIIGNLQTAQAQVGDVVTQQGNTLSGYKASLVDPLNTYSSSFEGISGSSTAALNSYESFSTSLNNTNQAFTDIADTKHDYSGDVTSVGNEQTNWLQQLSQQQQSILTYGSDFSTLQGQIATALQGLGVVNTQTIPTLIDTSLVSDTISTVVGFDERLTHLKEGVTTNNEAITTYLDTQYRDRIAEAIKASYEDRQGGPNQDRLTIGVLVETIRNKMKANIAGYAAGMTLYDDATIDQMMISESDKALMKNVNQFIALEAPGAAQYSSVTNQSQRLDELQKEVKAQTLTVNIATGNVEGNIKAMSVELAGDNYELVSASANGVSLPASNLDLAAGPVTAQVVVKVKESAGNDPVSLFSPASITLHVTTEEKLLEAEKKTESVTTGVVTETQEVPVESASTSSAATTSSADNTAPTPETPTTQPTPPTTAGGTRVVITETPIVSTQEKINTKEKIITRVYSAAAATSAIQAIKSLDTAGAGIADFQQYATLAGYVSAYYGISLYSTSVGGELLPTEDSLYTSLSLKELSDVVTKAVADTLVADMKEILIVPQAWIDQASTLEENATKVKEDLKKVLDSTTTLNTEVGSVIKEAQGLNSLLGQTPTLNAVQSPSNANMTEVTLKINSDLIKLQSASQTLMSNTAANQSVGESIKTSIASLNSSVAALEEKGKNLTTNVTAVSDTLNKEYQDNKEFLSDFTKVMENAKVGNKKNQLVYDYLSNPVGADNVDTTLSENKKKTDRQLDTRSGLVIVMIGYLMSVVVAHMFQHVDWSRWRNEKYAVRESWRNAVIPMLGMGILSVLIGGATGGIAGVKLNFSLGMVMGLSLIVTVMMLVFTLFNQLLLSKFKVSGMLFVVLVLMLYVITASQLFDGQYDGLNQVLSFVSPLSYVEGILTSFINYKVDWYLPFGLLVGVTGVLAALNIYHYRKIQ